MVTNKHLNNINSIKVETNITLDNTKITIDTSNFNELKTYYDKILSYL